MGGAIKAGTDIAAGIVKSNADQSAFALNTEQLRRAALNESANAVLTMQAGGIQAGKLRMEGSKVVAAQRVAFGASGVDGTTGTAADLATGSRLMSELDAQTAINNAARAALGHTQTAAQLALQQKALAQQYDAGQTANFINTGSKLVSDVGSFGSFLGG